MSIGTEKTSLTESERSKKKLDAQAWVSSDSYQMLGKSVMVRSTSSEFANQVRSLFRSFPMNSLGSASPDLILSVIVAALLKGHDGTPYNFVYSNYTKIEATTSYWRLFRLLEWQMDLFVSEAVEDSLLLHSGAVVKNGAGFIFPGESESGKSSLTTFMVTKGYGYLSDELAAIDPSTGELHAFPKPLSIKDTSVFPTLVDRDNLWVGPPDGEIVDEEPVWYAHAEDVAPQPIEDSAPVRYIIFPRYDSSTAPSLQPLALDEAMRRLIENCVNLQRFGREGLGVLGNLLRGARAFSLTTNSLEDTTALVNELVEG